MKKIFSVLLAIAMLCGISSLCASAADKAPVGQFIFDSTMNVNWWNHHATSTVEYDATEDAFKITASSENGNAVICNGHNAGSIDYFEDMGKKKGNTAE